MVQTVEPARLKEPKVQSSQQVSHPPSHVPAGHVDTQAEEPEGLRVPAAQALHEVDEVEAIEVEKVPEGQDVHDSAPASLL